MDSHRKWSNNRGQVIAKTVVIRVNGSFVLAVLPASFSLYSDALVNCQILGWIPRFLHFIDGCLAADEILCGGDDFLFQFISGFQKMNAGKFLPAGAP